jgi:hypothetical protein
MDEKEHRGARCPALAVPGSSSLSRFARAKAIRVTLVANTAASPRKGGTSHFKDREALAGD